jgi:hypothetical protein
LDGVTAGEAVPLPSVPPHITVQSSNVDMRAGPSTGSERLGRAQQDDQFELLGRSEDGDWVQGCCYEGQVVWIETRSVETSLPVSVLPNVEGTTPVPMAGVTVATAPAPNATVWRQDIQFVSYLEATQEPLVAAGRPIEEIRVVRHLRQDHQILDTERVRRSADGEEIVDEFP